MSGRAWKVPVALAATIVGAFVARRAFGRVEEPPFERLGARDGLEVRRYGTVVVAETDVEGPYARAANEGFRRLAGYIFGGNRSKSSIPMTAPVGMRSQGERIAMTAPVAMVALPGDAPRWTMTFAMPAGLTLESAPTPLDARVRLRAVPMRMVAVWSFPGKMSEELIVAQRAELSARLRAAGFEPRGPIELAQYNQPWIPGPWRRNELIVPIDELR